MLKKFKTWGLALAAATTLSLVSGGAAAQSGNLVSAEWLKDNLGNPDILLLDAQPTKLYLEGHVPGAQSVSFSPSRNCRPSRCRPCSRSGAPARIARS